MIDFEAIAKEVLDTHRELQIRVDAINAAFALRPPRFDNIPSDLYEGHTSDEGEGSELEKRFKELTFSYFQREPILLLDLNNVLIVLNHLQAVALKKYKPLLTGDVSEEDVLKKLFVLAAFREAEKTYAFSQVVEEKLSAANETLVHFELPFPKQDSEVTKSCKEKSAQLSNAMSDEAFAKLQDQIYSDVCKACNELAKLALEKIDVELGFLRHCADEKRDPETLAIKVAVFSAISRNAVLYLSKCFEYLEAIQLFHAPKAGVSGAAPIRS